MFIDLAIRSYFAEKYLEELSRSEDVVYILDDELRLRGYNSAWLKFAEENKGEKIKSEFSIGSTILRSTMGDLKKYFESLYREVFSSGRMTEFDYECSSASDYRQFRQSIYPLKDTSLLVLSNHLIKSDKNPNPPTDYSEAYRDENGILTQCSNCRKTRDPKNTAKWLWIPSLLEKILDQTSHSLCTPCMNYYYPDYYSRIKN